MGASHSVLFSLKVSPGSGRSLATAWPQGRVSAKGRGCLPQGDEALVLERIGSQGVRLLVTLHNWGSPGIKRQAARPEHATEGSHASWPRPTCSALGELACRSPRSPRAGL